VPKFPDGKDINNPLIFIRLHPPDGMTKSAGCQRTRQKPLDASQKRDSFFTLIDQIDTVRNFPANPSCARFLQL
jgi:hypothetical protein